MVSTSNVGGEARSCRACSFGALRSCIDEVIFFVFPSFLVLVELRSFFPFPCQLVVFMQSTRTCGGVNLRVGLLSCEGSTQV